MYICVGVFVHVCVFVSMCTYTLSHTKIKENKQTKTLFSIQQCFGEKQESNQIKT